MIPVTPCSIALSVSSIAATLVDGDPIIFPSRAGVGGEGLDEAVSVAILRSDDEADENDSAVDIVLAEEQASAGGVEPAKNRRGQLAAAHAGEVEIPLPGLRIVEPERQAADPAGLPGDV